MKGKPGRQKASNGFTMRTFLFTLFYALVNFVSLMYGQSIMCPSECTCLGGDTVNCNGARQFPGFIPENTKSLSLDRAQFTTIPTDAFAFLRQLKQLSIESSDVHTIEPFAFRGLTNMASISLKGNKITTLKTNSLSNITNVVYFHLNENQIETIEPRAFAGTKDIGNMNLNENLIRFIKPGAFEDFSDISTLKLAYLRVRNLTQGIFSGLSNVNTLTLAYSEIKKIEKGAFDGTKGIKEIKLQHCHIANIEKGAFVGLDATTEFIDLKHNSIETLPKGSLDGLEGVKEFNFKGNPFNCDCNIIWLRDFLTVKTRQTMKCKSPTDLSGLTLDKLTATDLTCPTLPPTIKADENLTSTAPPTFVAGGDVGFVRRLYMMFFFQLIVWMCSGCLGATTSINGTTLIVYA